MTQPQLESAPPSASGPPAKAPYPQLPHARPGGIAGLIELLHDHEGKEDLYHVAEQLLMDVEDLFPLLEAATLLDFARTVKGDVEITSKGKAFAEADISTRKLLFREAALANVPLLQRIERGLKSKADGAMPLEFFRDILEEHFSESEVQQQLDTALHWGRYGDIFTYDSETDRLLLHQPELSTNPDEDALHH